MNRRSHSRRSTTRIMDVSIILWLLVVFLGGVSGGTVHTFGDSGQGYEDSTTTTDARDADAMASLRNAAIALESQYAETRSFAVDNAQLRAWRALDPDIVWRTDGRPRPGTVRVDVNMAGDAYALRTVGGSGRTFSYVRSTDGDARRCIAAAAAPASGASLDPCPGAAW